MKKLRSLLLGTLAGLIWVPAVSLALVPVENYQGILHAIGCVIGGLMLFGLGCTMALAATNTKEGGKGTISCRPAARTIDPAVHQRG